jgi:hypothetical protein
MKKITMMIRKKITRHVNTAGTASTNISLGIRSRTTDGTNKLVNIDDDTNLKATNPTFKTRAWSAMGLIPPKFFLKSTFGTKTLSVWSGGTIQDASKSGNIVKKGFVALFTSKPMQGFIHTLDYVGDRLDFFDVAMTFTDAFYYCRPDQTDCPLPDVSELLSGAIFNNVARKALEYQKTALVLYNQQVDNFNRVVQDDGWPRVYEQFPLITGPLDMLDAKNANGDPYWIQQRVQTEIDAIRLKYLKDSSKPYLAVILDEVNGLGQDIYKQIMADPTDSVLYYIEGTDGVFSASMLDDLYREAFTAVCTYNGGIVYEDVYPTQDAGGNPVMSGRPRFQCGWSSTDCNKKAVEWMKLYESGIWPVGNYAEWFLFDDPDIAAVNPIATDSKLRSGSKTGACMITNSGSHGMCREYKGTYNFTTRRCEYTKEYCQSLGTCFNTTTKTCYLPADAMKAVSFFFGTGGPREFIKVHGCTFTGGSGQNLDQFLAVSGLAGLMSGSSKMFADAIKNVRNWGPGLRDSLGNPIGALGFSSSVLGIAAFAGAGPLAVYGSLLVGIGAGIAAGVDAANATLTRQKSPTGDVREYHIGGLETPSGASSPTIKAATLGDGWITKPLQIFPNGTVFGVRSISGVVQQRFFRDFDGSVDLDTYLRFGGSDFQNTCWTLNPPMIRAASDSGANSEWCIPSKPDAAAFTDTTIGELITEETYLYNRMWTDGKDPYYPSTVIGNMPFGPDRQNLWYYQLVYDREKMKVATTTTSSSFAGMTTGTRVYTVASASDFTVGNIIDLDSSQALGINGIASVSAKTATTLTLSFSSQSIGAQNPTTPVTIKGTMPLILWNDTVLKKYFDAQTISNMRQYYCTNAFYADLTGASVDKKCFGYLDVVTDKYNVRKMSVTTGHPRAGSATCSVTPAPGYIFANPGFDCTTMVCPVGSYCIGGGAKTTCTSGNYCPEGSSSQTPCAAGNYCATPSTQVACTLGNYCPTGSIAQTPCAAGNYCTTPSTQVACTFGNYCPTGSISQRPCSTCDFGDRELSACTRTTNRICERCPAGNYCPIEYTCTQCDINDYCPNGLTAGVCSDGQKLVRTYLATWPCDPGYYCPTGTFSQTQCLAGYYCETPSTQVVCTAGYYCPAGSTSQTECPTGYYCSTPATKVQCSGGYYCPAGSISQRQCQLTPVSGYIWANSGVDCTTRACTAGHYCPNATTETVCTSGNYCSAGTPSNTLKCYAGFYCTTPATIAQCTAGNYCPEGSTSQTQCTTGNYCPAGSSSQNQCTAGNYCTTPATQTPCDSGNYCPAGSTSQTLCLAGYYCSTPATRVQCTADQSCPAGSTSATVLTCTAGNYCPNGYNSMTQCTAGNYCPAGATVQTPCDSGNYCPAGSSSQTQCPQGYYCSTPATKVQCRSGFDCPPGSIVESKTFTTSGTWTAPFSGNIKVLVVGGGGAGGAGVGTSTLAAGQGGGGGGGGVKYNSSFAVTSGTIYNITVGTGGSDKGQRGGSSSFSSLVAGGGGCGRSTGADESTADGTLGSSGGGGAGGTTTFNNSYIGFASPPGYDGGLGTNSSTSSSRKGGGGGGAGGLGQYGGAGGIGITNNITGKDVYYGGGGGGYTSNGSNGGSGGGGNGGNGSVSGGGGGKPGTDGLGGGGGGGNYYATAFGKGGSGIVIITGV